MYSVVLWRWSLRSGLTRAKYDGRHLAERCFSREAGAAFYVFVGKFTLADFHSAPPARDVCVCVCVCVSVCAYMIFVIFAPQTRFLGLFLLHTKVRKMRQNV